MKNSENKKAGNITRVGVYGIVMQKKQLLLIRQTRGFYAGKLDFPGGGIEFSESPEQALRREFAEEVAMEFDSLKLVDNLTITLDVPKTSWSEQYLFYQIGMIYKVKGCRLIETEKLGEFQHIWTNPITLSEETCSNLLWKWKMMQ